tara:strand:- start:13652 stop:14581 length:930 start_codon:yes stop_codon:yes gene_type:complete
MDLTTLLLCEPSTHSFKLTSDVKGTYGIAWIDGDKVDLAWKIGPVEVLLALTKEYGHDFGGAIPKMMQIQFNRQDGRVIKAMTYEGEENIAHEIPIDKVDAVGDDVVAAEEDEPDKPYEFVEGDDQPGGDLMMMPDGDIWLRRRLVQHAKTVLGLSERDTVEWLEENYQLKVSNTTVHRDRVAVEQYWANEAVKDYRRHQAIILSKIDAREREATDQYSAAVQEVGVLETIYEQVQAGEADRDKANHLASIRGNIAKAKDQAIKWFAMQGKEIDRSGKALGVEPRSKVAIQLAQNGTDSGVRFVLDTPW